MVAYRPEAADFIRRASEYFPVKPEHAKLLLQLWVEADTLDGMILPLLQEMNAELLDGLGVSDTHRGASLQPSAYAAFSGDAPAEEVVYECYWTLNWGMSNGLAVILSLNEDGVFHVRARGDASGEEQRIGHPATVAALQNALVAVYVAEQIAI